MVRHPQFTPRLFFNQFLNQILQKTRHIDLHQFIETVFYGWFDGEGIKGILVVGEINMCKKRRGTTRRCRLREKGLMETISLIYNRFSHVRFLGPKLRALLN